ncbi:MAG: hypothetical protein JWR05_2747 [Mucilaginibacter sp.]|nr:hypothetical protein [Mucilaginibacter sp.]
MKCIIFLLIYPFGVFCPLAALGAAVGTGVCFAESFDAHKKRIAVELNVI